MIDVPGYLLIQGDARTIPLADKSVHMVACSPPYFGLRNYSHPSQIGLEPTPDEFVKAMRVVGREAWRVLRDDGSWWLNLGDGFARDGGNGRCGPNARVGNTKAGIQSRNCKVPDGLKAKDLILIPEQVALALRKDGWHLRAKPPWVKPSPMPESTDDRPNVAHESIFLLTKNPNAYFDMEAVRVPSAAATLARDLHSRIVQSGNKSYVSGATDHSGLHKTYSVQHDHETPSNPDGRHLRTNDFFTASLDALIEHHEAYLAHLKRVRDKGGLIASEDGDPLAFWVAAMSFNGAHFATWPSRLVRPMIKASTSEKGCCPACGAMWRRIVEIDGDWRDTAFQGDQVYSEGSGNRTARSHSGGMSQNLRRYAGWEPGCTCDAGAPVPCIVLDNFVGAGTTILEAVALGRHGIGIDLKAEYLTLAERRISRPHARIPRPNCAADRVAIRDLPGQGLLFPDNSATEKATP
jgi:DNA modification methylase